MTDVSPSPPYTVAFPISSFFPSSFLFFLRFTVADGFPHRWRKNVFTGTNPRAFIWQTGIPLVYSAVLRFPSVDVAFVAVQRDPPLSKMDEPQEE